MTRPALRIVRGGNPTPAELAAVVLAVTAAAAAVTSGEEAGRRRGGWADRSAGLRQPLRGGVAAWRHFGPNR